MSRLRRRLALGGVAVAVLSSLVAAGLGRKPLVPVSIVPASIVPASIVPAFIASGMASEAPALDGLVRLPAPKPVPDLAFEDIDGQTHRLRDYAGRVVLLNLWATWCGPCVAELPSLAALAPRAAQAGIVVLPLSVDRGGTARVRAFFASHGIDGLAVWNDADDAAGQALGLRGIPTTLLIDRQGREVARLEGAADWNSDAALATLRALAP